MALHNDKAVIIDRNVYDDINLFILRGLNQIAIPISYPYIKIDSLGASRKRVIYKISIKDSVERIYEKKNDCWVTSYEFKADTGYIKIYEYIYPEKIIELDYLGTYEKRGYHLHDATIIKADKMVTYGFWDDKGINISPRPNNFEIVKEKAKAIFTENIYNSNDILTITSSSFDKMKNEVFYSDTSCYNVNSHSWFWWRYFSLDKSIKCK